MNKYTKNKQGGYKRRRYLLIDSSLLMLPVSGGKRKKTINIEEALLSVSEGRILAVLSSTIEELNYLLSRKIGKKKLAADFALELIKRMQLEILNVPEEITKIVEETSKQSPGWEKHDEIIVQMAMRLKAAVATTDIELMHKLREKGITVFYLRGRKWIHISGSEL